MAMTVTAAGMTGQIFRKCSPLQQVDIFRNGATMGLKGPDAGGVQLMQRAPANTPNNNGVDMFSAQPGNRIARAMLMNPVTIADGLKFAGGQIDNQKLRGGAEMIEYLTGQTLIIMYRKTDFHMSTPFYFVNMHIILFNSMNVNM